MFSAMGGLGMKLPTRIPPAFPQPTHSGEADGQPIRNGSVTMRTRSVPGPFNAGVIFERDIDTSPPNDDEIIIVTIKVNSSFRRASLEGCDELPSRPPPRSYLRRMSTRLQSPPQRERVIAIKMPRRDYKRLFARDKDGKYVGTDPEQEWSEDDVKREFDQYQELPLRTIV